ncbi:MAG: hypothetical protein H6896_10210, partial [Rhodovulum sp.]|nr:hypothetical protein [Rhodovulum sp.]
MRRILIVLAVLVVALGVYMFMGSGTPEVTEAPAPAATEPAADAAGAATEAAG